MTSPILTDLPESITGPRIAIRPFRRSDAAALFEAIAESREDLAPWLPWVHGYTDIDHARLFIARAESNWVLREDFNLGIFALESDRLLGGIGLHIHDWDLRSFEIGYWLRRSATGMGYATDAARLLTELAFQQLQAVRVEIRMDPRNHASEHVAARLGYVKEGTLRQCAPDGFGKPSDRHVYSLTLAERQGRQHAGDPPAGACPELHDWRASSC